MMKILHIFKSKPDDDTLTLTAAWAAGHEVREFHLHQDPVDYEELVDLIFESDRVLSWF